MGYDFDLFVIGAGSGGVRAARIAAGHGARVGICEQSRVGGTCVMRGCVPKKLLVYGSHFGHDFRLAEGYGWSVKDARLDWARLIANKNHELNRLERVYHELLGAAGVRLFDCRGVFVDDHTIQVGDDRVTADRILIAVGGTPQLPAVAGFEYGITSNEALDLPECPKRVLIVGGGYIAVEFAGIFNSAGADVIQLYRGEQILRGFDSDVRSTLADELRRQGIDLRVETNVQQIAPAKDRGYVVTDTGAHEHHVDVVMFATGRRPNTAQLGLEHAGLQCESSGAIAVDAESRTSVPHIFAVGDVTNRINLTPVALMEGHAFADSEFGGRPRQPDHVNVPAAVFSQPPVATVGMAEHDARAAGHDVEIFRTGFRAMKYTLTDHQEQTMMKLIVDRPSRRVLGAHMVGVDAPEIMQGIAIALKAGATKDDFDATVGIHPTSAEEFVTMREPV